MTKDLFQSGSFLVVGVNDHQLCRKGWHDRAIDERLGIPFRPSSKEAFFDLFLPGEDMDMIALVSSGTTLSGGILRGSLFSNGNLIGDFKLDSESWVLRHFHLSNSLEGWNRFSWKIHNPFVPDEILKNGDFREIGLYVAAIRMERKLS